MRHTKGIYAIAIAVALTAFHSSGHAQKVPLPGTEIVATIGKTSDLESIAGRVTEVTGLPVLIVRKLDAEHAVFAVDQTRLLEQLQAAFVEKGAHVKVIPGVGPRVMGRMPVPRLQVALDQYQTPALWSAASTERIESGDRIQQPQKFESLSEQLTEITQVPVNTYAAMEKGCVIVSPAPEKYTDALKFGLTNETGLGAEDVQPVKAFGNSFGIRFDPGRAEKMEVGVRPASVAME